jgi:hypothetical protein
MRPSAPGAIGAAVLLLAAAIADLANAEPLATVGVRDLAVLSSERGMMLDVEVWCPAGGAERPSASATTRCQIKANDKAARAGLAPPYPGASF